MRPPSPGQDIIDAIRARKAGKLRPPPPPAPPPKPEDKQPPRPEWAKAYVAARFNHRESVETLGESVEKKDPKIWITTDPMINGHSIREQGSIVGRDYRRNFVYVVYYPNFNYVFNDADHGPRIMIPSHLLEGDKKKVWGSIAYVQYPGSPIHIFLRNEIENLLDTIHAKEVWKYRRTREIFPKPKEINQKRQYSYWLLPAEDLNHNVLIGGSEYQNLEIPEKHLAHIPPTSDPLKQRDFLVSGYERW